MLINRKKIFLIFDSKWNLKSNFAYAKFKIVIHMKLLLISVKKFLKKWESHIDDNQKKKLPASFSCTFSTIGKKRLERLQQFQKEQWLVQLATMQHHNTNKGQVQFLNLIYRTLAKCCFNLALIKVLLCAKVRGWAPIQQLNISYFTFALHILDA